MLPKDFISAIGPSARASMAKTRIPASFTVAEAALESGWGASKLAVEARNLFGVKADPSWTGETVSMMTKEFMRGQPVMVPARWRKYPDWISCIQDHAAFLLHKRYEIAFTCHAVEDFTKAIQAAGYATDPEYASKIMAVIRSHNLTQFDNP
jgi:flagellum-specific peptidoglycan hydrolase FlgJ